MMTVAGCRLTRRRKGKRPLIEDKESGSPIRGKNARIDSNLYAKRSLLDSINPMVRDKYGGWSAVGYGFDSFARLQ